MKKIIPIFFAMMVSGAYAYDAYFKWDVSPQFIVNNKSMLLISIGDITLDFYEKLDQKIAGAYDAEKNVYTLELTELSAKCGDIFFEFVSEALNNKDLDRYKIIMAEKETVFDICSEFEASVREDVNNDNKKQKFGDCPDDSNRIFELSERGYNQSTMLMDLRNKLKAHVINHYCLNRDVAVDGESFKLTNCQPSGVSTKCLDRDIKYAINPITYAKFTQEASGEYVLKVPNL